MTRGALLIALPAIFALLFSAFAQLYYLPAPAMLVLGVTFLLLGLMLIVLTVRQGETGKRKLFFILTGASAAGIPLAAVLHNFVLGRVLFMLALIVLPMLFVTGWAASVVLLATAEKPVTGRRKLLIGFVVLLVPAAVAALALGSGSEEPEVSSQMVSSYEGEIDRLFITASVEEPLMDVFYHSFEHSLISALQSNGITAVVRLVPQGSQGREGLADEAKTIVPDAWMQISVAPLYRTRKDGYEAIVGTVFEVSLIGAATGEDVWRLSGKVDYIADTFFKRPGYEAFEGIKKEFAWHTTAAIVETFMLDVAGRESAPIYTATESRERHGQRTD